MRANNSLALLDELKGKEELVEVDGSVPAFVYRTHLSGRRYAL